jgi:hypothetical protein
MTEQSRSVGPGRQLATLAVIVFVVVSPLSGLGAFEGGVVSAAANTGNVVQGTPYLNASAPDARFDPGEDGTLSVSLANDAVIEDNNETHPAEAIDRAGEARSITVNVTDAEDLPLTVRTSAQQAGTIQDGETGGPYNFDVLVDENAEAGTYTLNVTTEYRHAENVSYEEVADGEYEYSEDVVPRNETDTITVTVEPEPDFEVNDVFHDVPVSGEGIVYVDVTNTGDESVTDATLSLTSSDSDFYFGSGTASSESNVGEWAAGEQKVLRFRAGTVEDAVRRSYPIDLSLQYTDSENNQDSDSDQFGIVPEERTRFTVESVRHDVPQNGEGTITMNVTHSAGKDIDDVTVTAAATDTTVYLGSEASQSSSTQIEQWGADQARQITFRAGTGEEAVNRSYPIELSFEYTDKDDNDNSRTEYVEFVPQDRTDFSIHSLDHNVPQDGEGTITMNVSHALEKPVTDVTVTATASDTAVYLGSEASQSATTQFEDWGPNESNRLTFRAGTGEEAVNRSYPVELSFEYTDDDDNDNSHTEYVQFVPRERANFEIRSVEHDVPRDGTGELTVEVIQATPRDIEDVTVTATSPDSEIYLGSEGSPSGTALVDSWAAGSNRTFTFRPGTTANAVANRTYPIELSFEYTDGDDNDNSRTEYVQFAPRERPQFVVESIDHSVPIGGTGVVEITLRNEGPLNATGASVTANSNVDALFFGTGGAQEPIEAPGGISFEPPETGTPTTVAHVGEWPAGETRTVAMRTGFDENAIEKDYTADLTIDYDNERGDDMPDQSATVGLTPKPEQTFAFDRLENNLYVGEEGDLIGEVTNVANRSVDGVVVTVENDRQTITFYNPRYAVGHLDPGESATFRYRVGVTEEAEHGPKVFELAARYRGSENTVRQSDTRDLSVEVRPDRDDFAIETTNGAFAPGESGSLTLTVTNQRNETVTDVQAKLFTDDPLDSSDDEAFISSLDPGESATITMDLSVGGGAMAKNYSVSVDFRYDNARGESKLSDTYRVPVTVEAGDSGPSLLLIGGLAVALIVLVVVGWRLGVLARLRERLGG